MSTYIVTATTSSTTITRPILSDKVRIGTTVGIVWAVGNANVTASTTSDAGNASSSNGVIGANQVERDVYVGKNNYIAFVATSANGLVSITEVGAIPSRSTINGYYDGAVGS